MYFEVSASYNYSVQTAAESYYKNNKCLEVMWNNSNSQAGCRSCPVNYYLNTSIFPNPCTPCSLKGCHSCNSTTCLTGCGDALFFNATTSTCQFCFFSCKSCSGDAFDQCFSCKPGYFWQQNAYNATGRCAPCHAQCATCFGPASNQCGEPAYGYFFTDFGLDTNATSACAASCGECSGSATNCTSCLPQYFDTVDQFTLDERTGTCAVTDNSANSCTEMRIQANGSQYCRWCDPSFVFDGPTNSCVFMTSLGSCNITKRSPPDNRDLFCRSCPPGSNYVLNFDSNTCPDIPTAQGTICQNKVSYSLNYYCLNCTTGYSLDLTTGGCVQTCPSGKIPVTFNYVSLCMNPTPGCLAGSFDSSYNFFCSSCSTPNFMKYVPTDPYCLNLQCNTVYVGINKQCSPLNDPGTCDPQLCMWTNNTNECSGGTCVRKIFEVVFNGSNFKLQLNSNNSFFYNFDVNAYAVYDTTSVPGQKRVFCRLVSDDLDDELSTCVFTNGALIIETTTPKYLQLLSQGSLTLKTAVFKVFRSLLSIDTVDINAAGSGYSFTISPSAPINTNSNRGVNWDINYQASMPYSNGIKVFVTSRTSKYNVSTFSWECASVSPNAGLAASLNTTLQALNNSSSLNVPLTDTSFINQQVRIKSTIVDQFGQVYVQYFAFTVVSGSPVLFQPVARPVFYSDGQPGVEIPLISSTPNLIVSSIQVTAVNLVGTFTFSVTQRAFDYLLNVVTSNSSDFILNITYQSNPAYQINMIRQKPNYPSTIIHQTVGDNINFFKFQLINRLPVFSVFCVDEVAKTSCLPNSAIRSYSPGDSIVLQDLFNFTTTGTKWLFFRSGTLPDETVSSSVINGLLTAQVQTPELTSTADVRYPEAPFSSVADTFYLDFKASNVSSLVQQPYTYIDPNFALTSGTVNYSVASSGCQIDQNGNTNAFRMESSVGFTLNGTTSYSLKESRFLSTSDTISLAINGSSSAGMVLADFNSAYRSSGGTCNDPSDQFNNMISFNGRFLISDYGSFSRRMLIPTLFATIPLQASVSAYTNCGKFSSSYSTYTDSTGLSLASTLANAVSTLLLNLGNGQRDQLNNLNMILFQISEAYRLCNFSSQCIAPLAQIQSEAVKLLTKLPAASNANKFEFTSRYSFMGGFLWDLGLIANSSLASVLGMLEDTNSFLKGKIGPILLANWRFSRSLRGNLSALDLLLSDQVDYPVKVCSNLLNNLIFSYANDTERNPLVNRTIQQLVSHYELKLVRISSHKRKEFFVDNNVQVQGQTVLTPLDNLYFFQLDANNVLVFKNLQFASPKSYYEIIVLNWQTDLLTRMAPLYNASNNDFAKRNFFYQFNSYFKASIPIAGETQIYSNNCTVPQIGNCVPVTLPPNFVNFSLCKCENSSEGAGVPPITNITITVIPPTTLPSGGCAIPGCLLPGIPDVPGVLTNDNTEKLMFGKITNYAGFCYSTMALESVFTLLFLVGVIYRPCLVRTSLNYCSKVSTKLLIHRLLAQSKTTTPNVEFPKEASDGHNPKLESFEDSLKSSGSSSNAFTNLTPAQVAVYEKLKEYERQEGLSLKGLKQSDLQPLGFWSLYFHYLAVNHMMSGVAFLNSSQFNKLTILSLTYLRLIFHLGLSMYFTIGKRLN